jgi:hypothetical protein
MAGKTIEEARTVQRNARRSGNNGGTSLQQTPSATANVATTTGPPPTSTVTINGQTFTLVPTPTATVPASVNTALAVPDAVFPGNLSDYDSNASAFTPSVNIALALASTVSKDTAFCDIDSESDTMSLYDKYEYKAYVAMSDPSYTSVDWRTNSTDLEPPVGAISPVAFTTSHSPISNVGSIPFILDSGANCHISPERGDFKLLNAIPPLTVKGFGGSSIQAVGMGTIEVSVASGVTAALTATPSSDLITQVESFRDEQEVLLWYCCLQRSQAACGVGERKLRFTRDSECRIQARDVAYLYPYELG